MTTVKEFKDLGVEFVAGDKCRDAIFVFAEVWYVRGNANDDSFDICKVTHFAWRPLNTLPDNPKFKYVQDFSQAEIRWRPLLDQSDAKAGEPTKPVFTKEFAVRGGVNVEPIYKPCIVKYEGSKYAVVQDKNGREYARRKSKLLIRDIDTRTPKQKSVDDALELIGYTNEGEVAIHLGQVYDLWHK